jgi:hypothetical protein
MADDKKKTESADAAGPGAEQETGTLPPEPAASAEPEDEEPEERQKITLDRYLGSRKRTYTGWGQLVILLFMLTTLVLLMMYKDRCGDSVSSFIFMGTPDGGPTVRIKLDPHRQPPASRPAAR